MANWITFMNHHRADSKRYGQKKWSNKQVLKRIPKAWRNLTPIEKTTEVDYIENDTGISRTLAQLYPTRTTAINPPFGQGNTAPANRAPAIPPAPVPPSAVPPQPANPQPTNPSLLNPPAVNPPAANPPPTNPMATNVAPASQLQANPTTANSAAPPISSGARASFGDTSTASFGRYQEKVQNAIDEDEEDDD